ncbi:MAG TPA: carboxylic ester hydrolase [Candidatus Dormibacteraeota bacterium]|nr:carboxylic ester hydrolase [Candidatus Dormibacteraeota bacterium]
MRRRLSRRLAGGLAVGLAALALTVTIVLPAIVPVFQLPSPGGPYAIGTVTYHWVDGQRHELFSADPAAHRELMAQVWYPAGRTASSARAPYATDADALSSAIAPQLHLPAFAFDYWNVVPTNAIPDAPMATDRPRYPVLVFESGVMGFRQSNTYQVEALVSRGHVVVGLDEPYASGAVVFPDGRRILGWTRDRMQPLIDQSLATAAGPPVVNGQILADGVVPYLAEDVSMALDRVAALDEDAGGPLHGRLDLDRIGTFGVSLGAMVAAEACHRDARLKACLMLDAAMPSDVVRDGLTQPGMWITRDAGTMRLERRRTGGWSEADIAETLTSMRAVFSESPPGKGWYVRVPGIFHTDFTDAPSWTPLAAGVGISGPIGGQRAHEIVNAYSVAFFERYLEGRPSALLAASSSPYREVQVQGR